MGRKLHIGGKTEHPDWEIFNIFPGPGVDHVGNANDLSRFEDATFDEIYASHVLEHFHYMNELVPTLQEWYRVLKNMGILRISIPDMDVLCRLFLDRSLNIQERFHVMRMMFGGQTDEHDFHYAGLNFEFLHSFLRQVGFLKTERVHQFDIFEDTNKLRFKNILISLNVIAYK
jgi:predicted SAM-dependent methyltransferase